ncbi:MAG: hypothetical protein NVS1B4_17410 [Gemmatimonadaceae bacterium]
MSPARESRTGSATGRLTEVGADESVTGVGDAGSDAARVEESTGTSVASDGEEVAG